MLQLLFFDTFSHDTAAGRGSELNLDLVQFPSPVYVSEVRVIPLGSRVTANFPGGVRLGATNPSSFQLELFVNNLKAPGASTFESIGTLGYSSSSCISLPIGHDIATDGLVLRGLYSTITLAVYGSVSDSTPDQLARQGAEVKREVKEAVEEVLLPSTPLGESYAAQWTEKHKQVSPPLLVTGGQTFGGHRGFYIGANAMLALYRPVDWARVLHSHYCELGYLAICSYLKKIEEKKDCAHN